MFEPSEEMLKLCDLFGEMQPGAYITYQAIEAGTGVRMDLRGKSLMRSALRKLKTEYRSDRGIGIELASGKTAMGVITGKTRRISSSIKRANKCSNRLTKFIDNMPETDRARFIATSSLLGAVQAVSAGLTKIYKSEPEKLNTIYKIPLPKI